MILSIIYMLLILTGLIVVHELGHYLFARLFKVRIKEFAIGFGPKLYSKKGKETLFRINAFPLGGYVRMAGEDLDLYDDSIPKEEMFTSKPAWQRFLIAFSGPLFSVLAGFVVFAVIGGIWGFPEINIEKVQPLSPAYEAGLRSGDRIVSVNGKTLIQNEDLSEAISKGEPFEIAFERNGELYKSEAIPEKQPQEADIVIEKSLGNMGGAIKTLNGGTFYGDYVGYSEIITENSFLTLGFEDGNEIRGSVKAYIPVPERYTLGFYYANFKPVINKNFDSFLKGDVITRIADFEIKNGTDLGTAAQLASISENMIYAHLIGNEVYWYGNGLPENFTVSILRNSTPIELDMSKQELVELISQPNQFESGSGYWYPDGVLNATGLGVRWATDLLGSMFKVISGLFTGGTKLNQFAGPVGLVTLVGAATSAGFRMVLFLVGFISLNLGVINLLPLPALDGGRMILALVEIIIRRKLDPKIEGYIHAIGFIIIMALFVYITFIDIGRVL